MTIPSWVAGATVEYTAYEGDAVGTNTLEPLAISGNTVKMLDVAKSEESYTIEPSFTVGSAAAWGYQFWVDPSNPTASYHGPQGENYTVRGTETYDGLAATVMNYTGPDATGQVIFQTSTGLILEESATYENETTIQNLAGISSTPTATKTAHADGSYDILYSNVVGQTYSSYENIFNTAGAKVAQAVNYTNATGGLVLSGSGLKVVSSSTQLSVQTGADVFALPHFSTEAISATGTSSDAFVFTAGYGEDAIGGFVATGATHDTLQFSASTFSYLTAGMTQAQDLAAVLSHATQSGSNTLISDTPGDSLTLEGITKTTLSANAVDFKFA